MNNHWHFWFWKSILKKTVTVTEMPSAVFHYSQGNLISQEPGASKQVDSIFEAAKKDLLTLMKLDVSGWEGPPWACDLKRGAAANRLPALCMGEVWHWTRSIFFSARHAFSCPNTNFTRPLPSSDLFGYLFLSHISARSWFSEQFAGIKIW